MSFQGFDLPADLQLLSDTIAEFVREEIVLGGAALGRTP